MKKFSNYFLMMFVMLAVGFMTSCGDDDGSVAPGAPTIELSTDDGEDDDDFDGYVGDSVVLNIDVNAPSGFNTLRIFRQVDGVRGTAIETFSKVSGTQPTSFDTTFTYTIREDDVDNAVFLIFEAVEDTEEARTSILEYEIIAQDDPTIGYKTKLLYAPSGDMGSETFFSTNNGETYSVNEVSGTSEAVSALIDFGYYYGNTDLASLASPAAYPTTVYALSDWNDKNATKIRKTEVTATEFLEMENDVEFINQAFDEGTAGSDEGIATKLVDGQILAFELSASKGSKRGLIKITDIEEGAGTDGYIEMDIIVVD